MIKLPNNKGIVPIYLKNNRVLFAVRNKASKREEKEKGEPDNERLSWFSQ
jgi:hypothetical protein